MARKKKHEEHVNTEAWAIPYGDLVTLMFALFTVLYAVSSVNEGKFRILSDSLVAAFNGSPKTQHPVNIGEKEPGKGGEQPLVGARPTVLTQVSNRQFTSQRSSPIRFKARVRSPVSRRTAASAAPGAGCDAVADRRETRDGTPR